MKIYYDIETNGLFDATKVLCIGLSVDGDTPCIFHGDKNIPRDGTIEDAIKLLEYADTLIGHNICAFDNILLTKLCGLETNATMLDTLLIAKMMYHKDILYLMDKEANSISNKLYGSHALKAWGNRVGYYKGENETFDWQTLTTEMCDYCKQDVIVSIKLLEHLKKDTLLFPPAKAIQLEASVASIVAYQEYYGINCNMDMAEKVAVDLKTKKAKIEAELIPSVMYYKGLSQPSSTKVRNEKFIVPISFKMSLIAYYELPRFKNGKLKPFSKKIKYRTFPHKIQKVEYVGEYMDLFTVNLGSRQQVIEYIQDKFNINVNTYTAKGNPKTKETLLELTTIPEAKTILNYFKTVKDYGQIKNGSNSILNLVKNNRLHGHCDTLGTITHRATHNSPNMSQIPKQKEFRELLYAPKGYSIVGADLAGIELRVLAHYLYQYDKGNYSSIILNGDIHTANQLQAGLPTRNSAKTFIYQWLYGGGYVVLGMSLMTKDTVVECTPELFNGAKDKVYTRMINNMFPLKKDTWIPYSDKLVYAYIFGMRASNSFLEKTIGLKQLINKVQSNSVTNWIVGLDGRKLFVRSPHKALNTVLQNGGSVCAKVWMDRTNHHTKELGITYGIDLYQWGFFHDESQFVCKDEYIPDLKDCLLKGSKDVQKILNLNIPIDIDIKVGSNWWECH